MVFGILPTVPRACTAARSDEKFSCEFLGRKFSHQRNSSPSSCSAVNLGHMQAYFNDKDGRERNLMSAISDMEMEMEIDCV